MRESGGDVKVEFSTSYCEHHCQRMRTLNVGVLKARCLAEKSAEVDRIERKLVLNEHGLIQATKSL